MLSSSSSHTNHVPLAVVNHSDNDSETDGPIPVAPVFTSCYSHLAVKKVKNTTENKIVKALSKIATMDTPLGRSVSAALHISGNHLTQLAMDLRSYGNLRTKEACIQAAAVQSLLRTGRLFDNEESADIRYFSKNAYHLPRDIERDTTPAVFYVHFGNDDKRFLSSSKTDFLKSKSFKTTLSMRVSTDRNALVVQKSIKERRNASVAAGILTREARQFREGRLTGIPHLTQVLHLGTQPTGRPSLVLELDSLGPLRSKTLEPLDLSTRSLWEQFEQLLETVSALHDAEIVHSNLFTSIFLNKLRSPSGVVYESKITNMGLMGRWDANKEKLILPYALNSTYFPPELTKENRKDMALEGWKKVDVWELGLKGLLVFANVKARQLSSDLVPIKLVLGSHPINWRRVKWNKETAPPAIQEVLAQMLHPDPNQRLSAKEALTALREAIATLA